MDKIIYGADSETLKGPPMTLQFYSEDIACNDIFWVDAKSAAKTFLAWCGKRKRNVQHVLYVHNLPFDLISFLWGYHERFTADGGEFEFSVSGFDIKGIYGTPTYCTVRKGHDISVHLVDSFSFYRGSLAEAAKLFCPDLPKLPMPRGLGEKRFTRRDSSFIDYAMRDAEVTYHVGKAIEALHREFDLKQCISVADLAARVFRHRFLSYTIPQPPNDIVYAALDSYHGGKNNITVPPGWYTDVTSLDLSSAYPYTMQHMPAFSNRRLYRTYSGRSPRQVPSYGVYAIRGRVAPCDWPCLFGHNFKALQGDVSDVWVQGFELNEALRAGEFKPGRIRGYIYDAERDHQASALRGFVDDFYQRKESEKDKVRRYGYKLILNSISGKFIQTRKKRLKAYVDIDSGEVTSASELVAGGMFHPFIASAITAETRARIHQLEHRYKAIHTATDGIFTQAKRLPSGNKTLGSLSREAQGDLLLIRNKCYVLYQEKKAADNFPSKVFKRRYIAKYAKHGFQGSVYDLERLAATGKRKYTALHSNRLKESINRGLVPNAFEQREHTLKVGPIVLQKRK